MRIFTPMAMSTSPPVSSARRWNRQPRRRPTRPPVTDRAKATTPMTAAESRIWTLIKAIDTPTARASMLVAMASTHSRRADRSGGASSSSPQPRRRDSHAILPPMTASRPKATQWSTASMYWLTLLPSSQPRRGIRN